MRILIPKIEFPEGKDLSTSRKAGTGAFFLICIERAQNNEKILFFADGGISGVPDRMF